MQPKKVIVFQLQIGCRDELTNFFLVGWVPQCSFPECWQNNNILVILIGWNVITLQISRRDQRSAAFAWLGHVLTILGGSLHSTILPLL